MMLVVRWDRERERLSVVGERGVTQCIHTGRQLADVPDGEDTDPSQAPLLFHGDEHSPSKRKDGSAGETAPPIFNTTHRSPDAILMAVLR